MQARLETECLNYLLNNYPAEENGSSAASLLISRFRNTVTMVNNTLDKESNIRSDHFLEKYHQLLIEY